MSKVSSFQHEVNESFEGQHVVDSKEKQYIRINTAIPKVVQGERMQQWVVL